mmetsp:Transcript_1066/g.1587  ORF Transcript_1066/g.1587 Transcript_1066/m.1587 type:complete len:404 (-) Transcript_1066:285-1496(-)
MDTQHAARSTVFKLKYLEQIINMPFPRIITTSDESAPLQERYFSIGGSSPNSTILKGGHQNGPLPNNKNSTSETAGVVLRYPVQQQQQQQQGLVSVGAHAAAGTRSGGLLTRHEGIDWFNSDYRYQQHQQPTPRILSSYAGHQYRNASSSTQEWAWRNAGLLPPVASYMQQQQHLFGETETANLALPSHQGAPPFVTVRYAVLVVDGEGRAGPSANTVSNWKCSNCSGCDAPCYQQKLSEAAMTTVAPPGTSSHGGTPRSPSPSRSKSSSSVASKRKADDTCSSGSSIPSKPPVELPSPSKPTAPTVSASSTTKRRRVAIPTFKSFHERLQGIKAFKETCGHCNVPRNYRLDPSLGAWCNNIRYSYKQILDNKKPHNSLSSEEIEELTKLGFRWVVKTRRKNK